MFKCNLLVFVMGAFICMAPRAYCQEKVETRQIMTIPGIAAKVNAVGNIIEVKTTKGLMAFSVSDDANITRGTKKIGLMNIGESDPVTIHYYSPSPGKFIAVSITANKNS